MLQMIPIEQIFPHPDNPRKNLGDLSELAASIAESGILQNLTLVRGHMDGTDRIEDGYTIIIGHRRHGAAMEAGLELLPCAVVEMDYKEQITTMLVENMQRSDLTILEEAQGFQMMMDLGEPVEAIAQKSGFSTSTVRRRLKLNELDRDKLIASQSRGGTLEDYMDLYKIHDETVRNKVLEYVGTANFKNALESAVMNEKRVAYVQEALEVVSGFATKVEQRDYGTMDFHGYYDKWTLSKEITIPEDADNVPYYYIQDGERINVYRHSEAGEEDEAKAKERAQREAQKAKHEAREEALQEISARHYKLRSEFVKKVSESVAKTSLEDIMANSNYLIREAYSNTINRDTLIDAIDTQVKIKSEELDIVYSDEAYYNPAHMMLALVYASLDGKKESYWRDGWDTVKGERIIKHKENPKLDQCYTLLKALGYGVSVEEYQMQDGTHELLEGDDDE